MFVRMYICQYARMHSCTYARMYVRKHVWMDVCMDACMYDIMFVWILQHNSYDDTNGMWTMLQSYVRPTSATCDGRHTQHEDFHLLFPVAEARPLHGPTPLATAAVRLF